MMPRKEAFSIWPQGAGPVSCTFCPQKLLKDVYHVHVLQPESSSPTRESQGLGILLEPPLLILTSPSPVHRGQQFRLDQGFLFLLEYLPLMTSVHQ